MKPGAVHALAAAAVELLANVDGQEVLRVLTCATATPARVLPAPSAIVPVLADRTAVCGDWWSTSSRFHCWSRKEKHLMGLTESLSEAGQLRISVRISKKTSNRVRKPTSA